MKKLLAEFYRLYSPNGLHDLKDEGSKELGLISSGGQLRGLVLGFQRASDWPKVAMCHQGIQDDLEFPAPGLSVSGRSGYQLWLSLADGVSVVQAQVFFEALKRRYFADIPEQHLRFYPSIGKATVSFVPAISDLTGKWSAFIDPTMGAMFLDEPGLEMAPNMDRQADMLSGLKCIAADDFERALGILHSPSCNATDIPECVAAIDSESAAGSNNPRLDLCGNYADPRSFLLAVMNDPSASVGHRIDAAKALLPYFEDKA
jgi:hypothetical protein